VQSYNIVIFSPASLNVQGLDHLGIAVPSIAGRPLYEEVLGRRLRVKKSSPSKDAGRILSFGRSARRGAAELSNRRSQDSPIASSWRAADRAYTTAYKVDDVAASLAIAEAGGIRLIDRALVVVHGARSRFASVQHRRNVDRTLP
jgi:hypothetical protein